MCAPSSHPTYSHTHTQHDAYLETLGGSRAADGVAKVSPRRRLTDGSVGAGGGAGAGADDVDGRSPAPESPMGGQSTILKLTDLTGRGDATGGGGGADGNQMPQLAAWRQRCLYDDEHSTHAASLVTLTLKATHWLVL